MIEWISRTICIICSWKGVGGSKAVWSFPEIHPMILDMERICVLNEASILKQLLWIPLANCGWLGVGPMQQFVLKEIRTLVGPPLATRNLGSLALHCWAWRVRALWPTFVLGGRKSEARWGHLHPHRLSNLGLMNSLEDTVQACAWPRSGLASLLVELLIGSGAQKTFNCDLLSVDWF